jgi:hypothetical protein
MPERVATTRGRASGSACDALVSGARSAIGAWTAEIHAESEKCKRIAAKVENPRMSRASRVLGFSTASTQSRLTPMFNQTPTNASCARISPAADAFGSRDTRYVIR